MSSVIPRLLPRRRLTATAIGAAWVLTLGSAGSDAGAAAPVATGVTRFRIRYKNAEIGHHTVEIREIQPGDYHVATSIALSVKAGPITVYRFDHRCEEEWQRGQLVSLQSTTNDDGRHATVAGRRDTAGLALQTPSGPRRIPADILTSNSMWTARFAQQRQILDARQGDVIAVSARPAGKAMMSLRGWNTAADAYDIATSYLSGTVLYLQDRWVGGQIVFKGQTVAYDLD